MDGLLILDKPEGITSFGAVSRVRGILREKKIGHAGTLDPMATGVLPLFLGRATRAVGLLPCKEKTYVAGMRLGIRTDTGDRTGNVLEKRAVFCGRAEVVRALSAFTGAIRQVPPMYSACHVNGRRLYELAREGKTVERAARPVFIRRLDMMGSDEKSADYTLRIECSAGTYIRTLVEDIGAKLGCGAVMTSLRRTAAAGFTLAQAHTLEETEAAAAQGRAAGLLLPAETPFLTQPKLYVTDKQSIRFQNGGVLSRERVEGASEEGLCRVYAPDGRFLGLGTMEKTELKVTWLYTGGEANEDLPHR